MSGGVEQGAPEWQIEPAEVLRLALVLEIVEHGDTWTGREQGRGEAGIEQYIEGQPAGFERERSLLAKDAGRTTDGAYIERRRDPVVAGGEQIRPGLRIHEDDI